jgi:hypothetical protein
MADMIEESPRIYKRFVKHATSPAIALITAAHKSNTSSRLQDPSSSRITRQIPCSHPRMINPRNTGGPILAPIAYDFMLRPVVHVNVRRFEIVRYRCRGPTQEKSD